MPTRHTYSDFWIRLIGSMVFSHFVEVLGREESLTEQWLDVNYWIALASGGLIAFAVWSMISRLTIWLDRRYDWLEAPIQRISLQTVLGVLLPAVLVFLLTWIQISLLWDQNLLQNGFHLTEFPIIIFFLFLINGIYFTWYLYNQLQLAKSIPPADERNISPPPCTYPTVLLVNSGKMKLPIKVDSIRFISRQGDYTLIKTADREYIESISLDELESSLDPVLFFRANRQVIISYASCKGIRSLDYGKLEVQTDPPLGEPLVVSQKKARAFREWISKR